MKTETLVHQHPPTPPNLSIDLNSGFHHLAQYNADHVYSYDESGNYGVGYAPPASIAHDQLLQHPTHARNQVGDDFGHNIQYVGVDA